MKYSLENWIEEDGEKFLKDIGIKKKGAKRYWILDVSQVCILSPLLEFNLNLAKTYRVRGYG